MSKYVVATLVLLPLMIWGAWRLTPATFTIRNESGQSIRILSVQVAGKTFRYEGIPARGEVRGSFHFDNEASLDVRGELADGTRFGEYCGYVVWEEFAPHVNVAVRDGGWVGIP